MNAGLAFDAVAQLVPIPKPIGGEASCAPRRHKVSESISPELFTALIPQMFNKFGTSGENEITISKPAMIRRAPSQQKLTQDELNSITEPFIARKSIGAPHLLTQLRAAINADLIHPQPREKSYLSLQETQNLLDRLSAKEPVIAPRIVLKRHRTTDSKRRLANERYVHQLAIPKKKPSLRQPSPRRTPIEYSTQQAQVNRLSQPHCLDSTLARISASFDRPQPNLDFTDDTLIQDIPLPFHKDPISPSPYTTDLSVLVPGRPQQSSEYMAEIRDRIFHIKSRLLDIVSKCESYLPGEFDDWMASVIEVEILPSLSRRPLIEQIKDVHGTEDTCGKTTEALSLLDLFQPNELLFCRLDNLRKRIGERLESLVRIN